MLFLDSEFTGLHQNTSLISLAIVSEDDKIFYAEFNDYDVGQLNDWLKENVIKNLVGPDHKFESNVTFFHGPKKDKSFKQALFNWLAQYQGEGMEVWVDVGAWDWMLFCEAVGGAMNLPKGMWYIPYDLATLMKVKGIDPDIDRMTFALGDDMPLARHKQHNALGDALAIKECYTKITKLSK